MKETTAKILDELCERYPALSGAKGDIRAAFTAMQGAAARGGKILVCGNGGSAADSEHIVGELMKSFKKRRPIDGDVYDRLGEFGADGEVLRAALDGTVRAMALTSHLSLSTAFANDKSPEAAFSQQVYGYGDEGDVLVCISTSGNSRNCVLAAMTAKAKKIAAVALTGKNEGSLSAVADVTIRVPETETYKVQELHLPVYHCLCAMLEEENF